MPLLVFGGGGDTCVAGETLGAARGVAVAATVFPGDGDCGSFGGTGIFLLIACIWAIAAADPVTLFRTLTIPLCGSRSSNFG